MSQIDQLPFSENNPAHEHMKEEGWAFLVVQPQTGKTGAPSVDYDWLEGHENREQVVDEEIRIISW